MNEHIALRMPLGFLLAAHERAQLGEELRDDAEVSRLMVLKLIGAQGEAPFVRVTVMQMGQIES